MLDDGIATTKVDNNLMSAAGSNLVGFGEKKAPKSQRAGVINKSNALIRQ
jgi:hypothetical protein